MNRAARIKLCALAILFPILLVACGGGGGVSPEAYAADFCGALQGWINAIQERSTSLGAEFTAEDTPADRQDILREYLDGVLADTDELLAAVDEAGIPDVEGGEDIAKTLRTALEEARSVLEDARAQIEDLPTDDAAAFDAAADELGSSVEAALGGIGASLGNLGAPELDQAFTEDAACANLGV